MGEGFHSGAPAIQQRRRSTGGLAAFLGLTAAVATHTLPFRQVAREQHAGAVLRAHPRRGLHSAGHAQHRGEGWGHFLADHEVTLALGWEQAQSSVFTEARNISCHVAIPGNIVLFSKEKR
jgi:hypothetical protein